MNKVMVSGVIVNLPAKYFITKNGVKVMNNQIDVARTNKAIFDRINFTAWGETAELLTKVDANTIVEMCGEWQVCNFTTKDGRKARKDCIKVDKIDFAQINIEEVAEQEILGENLDELEITEDDLPF